MPRLRSAAFSAIMVCLVLLILSPAATSLASPGTGGNCHACHSFATLGDCLNCHNNSTKGCLACHDTVSAKWLDNQPSARDVILRNALPGYKPLNLLPSRLVGPFYQIARAYRNSSQASPSFRPGATDYAKCIGCHVSFKDAHLGAGAIPSMNKCSTCKPGSDLITAVRATAHANSDLTPGRFFDQTGNGGGQAIAFIAAQDGSVGAAVWEPVRLFRADKRTPVTKNQRIEECSVCHNYALLYPTLTGKIAQGKMPNPQVSCAACHDAHLPSPSARQTIAVDSTVKVSGISSSTVTAVVPETGRSMSYINSRPFKVMPSGAQNVSLGKWERGSDIAQPRTTVAQGQGTVSSSGPAISDLLAFPGGLFTRRVKPMQTLFVSGQASATVNLPAGAVLAGSPVTVRATLDMAGFEVEEVINDDTLSVKLRTDSSATSQLGTDQLGVVAKATVTYVKTDGKKGTLAVYVPFNGLFDFKIRDMRTDTEALCASCHTQGSMKYSSWGKKANGTMVDVRRTHAADIGGQYRHSGHGRGGEATEFPAFDEFSSFTYGSHQAIYPFDMSIKGPSSPPQLDQLANKGNTTFALDTPDAANAYLSQPGNTSLPVLVNNYACNQCHHGLAAIDFLLDRQGTPDARVLWGDASVTCITCHAPHGEGAGMNVRQPVRLSYNNWFADPVANPRGGLNKFMDGTDIPSGAGTSVVCLFCHQGRESGLSVYLNVLSKGQNLYTMDQAAQIDPVNGISTINPHYLGLGSQLWSRNAWEFIFDAGTNPRMYSTGILQHQLRNCTGCHMTEASSDNKAGGHTWKARIEACRECHGPALARFEDVPAAINYDGDPLTVTTVQKIGTVSDDGSTGSGLFWLLAQELNSRGIVFKPGSHPYMFDKMTSAAYKAYTAPQLQAAFNLLWAFKVGKGVYYHNAYYVAQILQDSIVALGGTLPAEAVRPTGSRAATDYRTIDVNP